MGRNVFTLLIITYLFIITSGKNTNNNKNVKDNSLKIPKDLSKLMDLKLIMEKANPNENSTDATQVSAERGPCSCEGGICTCCSRILLNTLNQKACVNVTYDPNEFSFTATVSMNGRILYTRAVSGKNPRPVCVPVPRIPAIRVCVRFYNIYFQGRNVHACLSIEGKFSDTTLFKMPLDCIRLGSNGVASVKPEDGGGIGQVEFLPDDPEGANNSDSEEYNEDGDDDDDY